MPLKPLNDAVFGEPVVRDRYAGLASEVEMLTQSFEEASGIALATGGRQLTASLAPSKVPYQVRVVGVGPECKEVRVGDLAILPEGGGTMITVRRGDVAERLYMIAERHILAVYRDEGEDD